MSAEVTLWDAFSATINLRVAQPQPHLGLIQLNARRGASSELISCDVRVAEFCKALTEVTGLVVLDPESDEDVRRLCEAYKSVDNAVGTMPMQRALRELANPTPPKPDEPTAHLAVVEDVRGVRWVNWRDPRAGLVAHNRAWQSSEMDTEEWRNYADIDAVRVLSEGVPE